MGAGRNNWGCGLESCIEQWAKRHSGGASDLLVAAHAKWLTETPRRLGDLSASSGKG